MDGSQASIARRRAAAWLCDPTAHAEIVALRDELEQLAQREAEINASLADFIAPADSGKADYIGGFCVSTGHGVDELVAGFQQDHDDYNSIMVKAIADRLAEAFAEYLHRLVRTELWAYAQQEQLSVEELIRERYRGIRPAPGYPACPDHTEKATLFKLLDAPNTCGVELSENYAMSPAAAVSGFYFSHPEAEYFAVGKIGRDQVESIAQRKGEPVAAMERWLRPNLDY